jgi:hypothetical protein
MRKLLLLHAGVVCVLALGGGLLFFQGLDNGFWSPEDFHALRSAAMAHSRGELPIAFWPSLAGGYPVNPFLAIEFRLFGTQASAYYSVNLVVHILNAYLAFLLVHSLLHDRRSALVAALLFVLGVGSYGKNLLFASGISSLLYATTCLSATLLYVQNEKRNAGRPWGVFAFGFFGVFICSLFMKGGMFSVLSCALFYNLFFKRERQRSILHTNLLIGLGVAAVSVFVHEVILEGEDPWGSAGSFLRNLPGYLILMVFPLQQSELLDKSPPLVRALYAASPFLRFFVGLTILSYSIFGLVFGGRAIRFYVAWMYVLIVPFAFLGYPDAWLNLRFLYLVSLAFCVLLTTGSTYVHQLLAHRGARKYLPFAIPAIYVVVSVVLVSQLNSKNRELARHPSSRAQLERVESLLLESRPTTSLGPCSPRPQRGPARRA